MIDPSTADIATTEAIRTIEILLRMRISPPIESRRRDYSLPTAAAGRRIRDTLNKCVLPLFRNAQPKARFWLGLHIAHLRARFGGPFMGRTDALNCSEHP